MRDIVGKVKGATDRSVIIGIAVIVLLVIIFGVVRFAGNDADTDLEGLEFSEGDVDVMLDEGDDTALAVNSNPQPVNSNTMMVRIPVLAGELFDMTEGEKRGCDFLVFIDREVPKSPAILNATLSELLTYEADLGFEPGNFIASREGLSFDRAEINEDGLATIYLTGEVGELEDECDQGRLSNQLKEAAFQFDSVKSVKVMLNDEILRL